MFVVDSVKSWCVFDSNILAIPSGHYRFMISGGGNSFFKEATIQEGEDWVYDFTADKISKEVTEPEKNQEQDEL